MLCVEHRYLHVVPIGMSGWGLRRGHGFEFGSLPFKRIEGTIVLQAPDGRKITFYKISYTVILIF